MQFRNYQASRLWPVSPPRHPARLGQETGHSVSSYVISR